MSGEMEPMEEVSRVQKRLDQMESRLFGVQQKVRSSTQTSSNAQYDFDRNKLGHWYKDQVQQIVEKELAKYDLGTKEGISGHPYHERKSTAASQTSAKTALTTVKTAILKSLNKVIPANEGFESKRSTQSSRSTPFNNQLSRYQHITASNSPVAKFDARYRGLHARLSAAQRQNSEFDIDFPNFHESGVVLEEVQQDGFSVENLFTLSNVAGNTDDYRNEFVEVLQQMLDNSRANQQSDSDEESSSDEEESAKPQKPEPKKTSQHLYAPVLRVKQVERLIPRLSNEFKVGDELVGYRLIFRNMDEDPKAQMPSSTGPDETEEGFADVYHGIPSAEQLSELRGPDAGANCSLADIMKTLLQYPLSDYNNEDAYMKSTYEIQFFFARQLSGTALPPSERDPKVNLSCRAVAVDCVKDVRLPRKTSLKVQISLGEHCQQSATLMPTIVTAKPANRVQHVPVDAASEEVKNDTCVFMPTAGALIGSETSDNRPLRVSLFTVPSYGIGREIASALLPIDTIAQHLARLNKEKGEIYSRFLCGHQIDFSMRVPLDWANQAPLGIPTRVGAISVVLHITLKRPQLFNSIRMRPIHQEKMFDMSFFRLNVNHQGAICVASSDPTELPYRAPSSTCVFFKVLSTGAQLDLTEGLVVSEVNGCDVYGLSYENVKQLLPKSIDYLDDSSSKRNNTGKKVRIRFRGTNFHNALLFSEALPELTALWRSLQIMRAHLVKRLKHVLGERSSEAVLRNLSEAQQALAIAKKKIVHYAVVVHEQLKNILAAKRTRTYTSQSTLDEAPSKNFLSSEAIWACKEKMSFALEAVFRLKKDLQQAIVMESRSKLAAQIERMSAYEGQLSEIMNSNNQVEEYMEKMLQVKPASTVLGPSVDFQSGSFVVDHVKRQQQLLQQLEKLQKEEHNLQHENARLAADLAQSNKVVNRNLKAKLKAFSKPQIFNSDLEYDDLRELREFATPGDAKATSALTRSQIKSFFRSWSEHQKFDFLRKISLEEFALLVKHDIVQPPSAVILDPRTNW